MNIPASSNSAALVIENFDDMPTKDYLPGEAFDRPSMKFSLLANSAVKMSIVSTTGSNVDGKALVLRKGTLEIQFKALHTCFGFWYTNAEDGFTVTFFDRNGVLIEAVREPDHGGGEKEFQYQTTQQISKAQVVLTADNMLIDSICLNL